MSGQLAYSCDEKSIHEAHLLAPEHGHESFRIAVQEVEESSLFAALLEWNEAADRRPVDERNLNGHRAVGHLGRRIAVRRGGLDAGHLILRDEKHFLFIEEEREERRVFVEEIDWLLRLGAHSCALRQEHVTVEPSAIREDDTNGPTQLLDAKQSDRVHGGRF